MGGGSEGLEKKENRKWRRKRSREIEKDKEEEKVIRDRRGSRRKHYKITEEKEE